MSCRRWVDIDMSSRLFDLPTRRLLWQCPLEHVELLVESINGMGCWSLIGINEDSGGLGKSESSMVVTMEGTHRTIKLKIRL